jgi:DNA-binding NarL/FixJ family response regulator
VNAHVGIAADVELTARRINSTLVEERFHVAIEASSPAELAAGAGDLALDAIVLAMSAFPSRSAVAELGRSAPGVPVVVVCPPEGWSAVRRALEAGVDGLVPTAEVEKRLGAAIRAVCLGHVSVPRPQTPTIDGNTLSSREKQVLGMVVMGFSNGEIARKLHLAESTVKSHLSCAFVKLGVRSRKEAADLVLDPTAGVGTGILAISSA